MWVWEDFVNEEGKHKEPMVCVECASTTMFSFSLLECETL
jgi:hypothetical protein